MLDPLENIEKKDTKSKYQINDIVLIHYFYNGMITPVKIIDLPTKSSYTVSHNIEQSKIQNAPNETVKSSEIICKHKHKNKTK